MDNKCWQWQGRTLSSGYGYFSNVKKKIYIHRYSYELLIGPIPKNMTVDHLCRNRGCYNPHHMEIVTVKENVLRGVGPTAKNAKKTHCSRGHPLSGDNLYIDSSGWRQCKKCIFSYRNNWRKNKWKKTQIVH